MKKSKKRSFFILASFVFALAIIIGALMLNVFANDEEDVTMKAINDALSAYKVGDTVSLADDGYIGIEVELTTYYDCATFGAAKTGYHGTNIAVYFVNTAVERVGTETDAVIIEDMLDRGFAVVVANYKGNSKATGTDLDWSSQEVRKHAMDGSAFTDKTVFPEGTYSDTHVVPAGYSVIPFANFWSLDKHGADGSLEKIVEIWNNDFRGYHGEKHVVKWVKETTNESGETVLVQKKTQNGFDGSAPQWYSDPNGENPVDADDPNAIYIKIKHTLAETITDCTAKDGSPMDLDLSMHIVYPVNPETSVPVMMLSNSSGYLSTAKTGTDTRPQLNGYLFRGYAGVIYDHLWTPMGEDIYYGYFDGSTGGAVTGDHMTYSLYNYNNQRVDTAAVRYLKYLTYTEPGKYSFDTEHFGIFGNSKGGCFTFMGSAELKETTTVPDGMSLKEAIEDRITGMTPQRIFEGHYGESRYQNGKTEDYTADGYTIRGGKMQPWTTYEKDGVETEILASIAWMYAANGGHSETIREGHVPIFTSMCTLDSLNNAYGNPNRAAAAAKTLDIPCLYFIQDIGHTFAYGPDNYHNVDTYEAMFAFSNYYLRGDAVQVLYTDPGATGKLDTTVPITVKFTGGVTAAEIAKITLTDANGNAISGTWESTYGGTEWTFTHEALLGGTEYTLTVPADLAGDNKVSMVNAYTVKFITEGESESSLNGVESSVGTFYTVSKQDMTNASEAHFRFFVENDAANVAELYLVTSYNEASPKDSAIGGLVGKVSLSGSGYYEINVSDIVGELVDGESATFLLKTAKTAGEKVVYYGKYGESISDLSYRNYTNVTVTTAPDGTPAVKYTLTTNIDQNGTPAYKGSTFYGGTQQVIYKWQIFGYKFTDSDVGRQYTTTIRFYDTTSRRITFMHSNSTNKDKESIDLDYVYKTVDSVVGWNTVTLNYTVYDPLYGDIGLMNKSLQISIASDGIKESPIYFEYVKATEKVTNMNVTEASIALTGRDGNAYKKASNDSAFKVGENYYSTLKAAMAAYTEGATVVLQKNYTVTSSDIYSDYGAFEKVEIDLNGYKLYADASNPVISAKADSVNYTKTEIALKNGSVFLGNSPLVSYAGSTSSGSGKEFVIRLTDIKLMATDGKRLSNIMSDTSISGAENVSVKFELENCVLNIDRNKLTKNIITVFPSGAGELSLAYDVVGGSINLDSLANVKLWNNYKHVLIEETDSARTPITLPISARLPSVTAMNSTAVGEYKLSESDGYTSTYTVETGSLSTKYGIIPEKYANVDEHPVILFDEIGKCIGSYKLLLGDKDGYNGAFWAARNLLANSNNAYNGSGYGENAKSAYIVVRKNYVISAEQTFNNFAQIQGSVTVDLMGNTISQGECTQSIFNATSKGWKDAPGEKNFETTVNICNGTLLTNSKGVIEMSVWDSVGGGSVANKQFNFNFNDVTIGLAEGATASSLMASFSSNYTPVAAPFSVVLDDCVIDLETVAPTTAITLFDTATAGTYVDVDYVINGGKILAGDLSNITIEGGTKDYTSSVTFGKGEDGSYTELLVDKGTSVEMNAYTTYKGESYGFVYSYTNEEENKDVYTLAESDLITKYGVIPAEYANKEAWPFVVFDGNGNFLEAYPHFLGKETGPMNDLVFYDFYLSGNEWNETTGEWTNSSNGGKAKTAYILMRRNYAMTADDVYSNNAAAAPGEFTLDLGGFTLSQGVSSADMFKLASKARNYNGTRIFFPTTWNVCNGTILAKNKQLIHATVNDYTNDGKAANKTMTMNFTNVKFGVESGSSIANYLLKHTNEDGDGTVSAIFLFFINFYDCIFDFETNASTSAMTLFNNKPEANHYSKISINVYGGEIRLGSKTNITISSTNGINGSSNVFYKNSNGEYTKLNFTGSTVTSETLLGEEGSMKYVLVDGANYVLAPLSALHNPYGADIPQKYGYAEKYPVILLDQNGKFLDAKEKLYGANGSGGSALNSIAYYFLKSNAYDADTGSFSNTLNYSGIIILIRRDYVIASDEFFDNLAQIQGEIVIDLCGHSIIQDSSSYDSPLFRLISKGWSGAAGDKMFPTTITVKNGSIYMYKNPVTMLQTWDTLGDGTMVNKVFTLTFDNVKFGLTEGATVTDLLLTVSDKDKNSKGGTAPFVLNFKDCVYDLETNSNGKTVTLFNNVASAAKYAKCTLAVEGGKVIVSDTELVNFFELDTSSGSSITFANGTEGAFALELPSGVTAPATEFNISGGKAVFVEVSSSDGKVIYKLRPVATLDFDFTPKMSITLDSNLVMNVYVPANSSLQKFVFDGKTYTASDFASLKLETVGGKRYYIVSVALPAAVAAKDVKLVATLAVDGGTAKATFTFSIPKYAEKVMAGGNADEIALIKDVLLYVKAAYAYFGTEDAEKIAKIDTLLGDYTKKPTVEGSAEKPTAGISSVTFVLDGTPSMRFYIAEGRVAADYKFYIGTKEVKTQVADDGTYVDIDVYAYELCETVTYTVGEESGSFHINAYYSYVSSAEYTEADKAELVELTECFWNYLQSARAYRSSVVEK
ncbi:MAG: hypothetical protein IJY23_04570 [Clostridia bacterium]|nr:hypothetical protein [Clostridia bacterium]